MTVTPPDDRSCRPAKGKTYLTIGQDLFSIDEYLREQYNYSLHHHDETRNQTIPTLRSFLPAAFMFYTDIQTLRGLTEPVDYGSGVEYADGLLTDDHVGLQVGLWLNGTEGCLDIVAGKLHHNIHRLFHYFLTDKKWNRVFLRVGYEFDNPSFGYAKDPAAYQQAFSILVDTCRKIKSCSEKIIFVWHSWAAGSAHHFLDEFYPGDDYVDWIGVSLFSQLYNNSNLAEVLAVLAFARLHDKPVMIAESTPFGGIHKLHDPWKDWFRPVLRLIDGHANIAMWSYINCDWESQPMWKGAGFGDTRLSTNQTVMKLWREKVLQNPRFLQAGTLCQPHRRHVQPSVPVPTMGLTLTGSSQQLVPSFYWLGAVLIALMAVCLHLLCRSRGPAADGYVALNDDDEEEEEEHGVPVEDNRTGYGTLR